MVSLLVPEAEWAPQSWGTNHPLYVRAQIEYGLHDAQLGYWGLSAASAPDGGYGVFGVAALGVRTHSEKTIPPESGIVAPYASFLALQFAPLESVANLRALADDFPVYGPYGFQDSVDVMSGHVSDRVLVLDQGMILASLANVIGSDPIRRGFCVGSVESKIRPLIAQERFDSRSDSSSSLLKPSDKGENTSFDDLSLQPAEQSLAISHPLIRSPHLVGGILTAAGAYAVFATRFRAARGLRPTSVGSRLH